MINIPQEFLLPLKTIIEWNLSECVEDIFFGTPLKRLLERINNDPSQLRHTQIQEKELYSVYDSVVNARNYAEDCGVERNILQRIYDWIRPIYERRKRI